MRGQNPYEAAIAEAPAIRARREPRIGIGLPVYNGERHIRQAIESHLSQTFGDFELVIADNQSTDGTETICRELAALDERVRYIRNEANLGGPGNFRRVFSHCRGEYHKWSTADDWHAPTFFAKAVEILDRDAETILVYPKTILVDETGNETGRYETCSTSSRQSRRAFTRPTPSSSATPISASSAVTQLRART
jgi:glycosyltransferase involved in cell wall biosynthesis